jgi:hypothetical protein
MSEITKLIAIYGLGTVAGAFLIFLLYMLAKFFISEFKQMRQENREAFGEVIKQGAKFADTVDNHMDSNTRAIERLCDMWDTNSKGR